MKTIRIMSVVGARPNFMKIAPFVRAVEAHNREADVLGRPIEHYLVHTGQHYDVSMSESFFRALDIPAPNIDLGVGSGTHAEQVGRTMIAFEKVIHDWKPDWVVVVGDINATCACSITAKKEGVNLAHIEAGLRSFDLRMPEEINRLVTDRLSDLLFATDEISCRNLCAEGVPASRIKMVGNVMIDTLEAQRERAARLDLDGIVAANLIANSGKAGAVAPREDRRRLPDNGYALLTLHRPSNVDVKEALGPLVDFFVGEVAAEMPLVWTIHPRTRARLKEFGLWERLSLAANVLLLDPVGYHELLRLNQGARILMTDSGGLQEESCILGTPCVTLRENTERPITLRENGGVSGLSGAGDDVDRIRLLYHEMKTMPRRSFRPPLWDGHTAERIVRELLAT